MEEEVVRVNHEPLSRGFELFELAIEIHLVVEGGSRAWNYARLLGLWVVNLVEELVLHS